MGAHLIKLFFIGVSLCITSCSLGQNLLLKKTTLKVSGITIKETLLEIENQEEFHFAYNSSLFNPHDTLSLHIENQSIEEVLLQIFHGKITGVHRGGYIVLYAKRHSQKRTKEKVTVTGKVIDGTTGKQLTTTTVYEVKNLKSSSSGSDGEFNLTVKTENSEIQLAVSREEYRDTVITVSRLDPHFEVILYPDNSGTSVIRSSIDSNAIVKIFVKEYLLSDLYNVDLSEKRFLQFSILPALGSNQLSKGKVDNNLSINLIAGLTQNVNGLEMGGVLNIVRENINGLQMAGIGNFVSGTTSGLQMGGCLNHSNVAAGVQMAGIYNKTDTITGLQMGGLFNTSLKTTGFQMGGIYNHSNEINGFQIAGIYNQSDSVKGGQLAGIYNKSNGVSTIQVAGIHNRSDSILGGQLAGISNVSSQVNGVQIAGIINRSKTVKGFQIAPINVSDSVSGAVFGILNFVKSGLSQLEIESTDMYHTQVNYKSGTSNFYSILSAGLRMRGSNSRWSYGFGLGSQQSISNSLITNLEVIAHSSHNTSSFNFEKATGVDIRLNLGMLFNKKRNSINIGPVIHFYTVEDKDVLFLSNSISDILPNTQSSSIKPWIGYRLGLQF